MALADRSSIARFIDLARDIKLSHSVFALPFAVLATFLAAGQGWPADRPGGPHSLVSDGRLPRIGEFLLIVACMFCARTVAMIANRLLDAGFDAANPRTARRAVPAGRLTRSFLQGAMVAAMAGFVAGAAGFRLLYHNPWPLLLAGPVLGWVIGYSLTKRFTWLCHLFLGSALALSPLAAAVAISPPYLTRPEPWLLAGMVLCWVAGFDIIYALQDVAFDRSAGLYSMPASLGIAPALWIAGLLHLACLACLALLVPLSPLLGPVFAVGVAAVAALLLLEHALVWRSSTHHIHLAFFTVNGVISLLLGGLGVFEVVRVVAR